MDSHANMPVVGRHALVIDDLGTTVDVTPFSPDYQAMQVKMVDAAVQYDCPFTGNQYMLLIRNAISVPAMTNNLIPPFIMREAGIIVNDVPKIQVPEPTEDHHALIFPETGFRIPLSLIGVFSYFYTSKPTEADLDRSDQVYTLTPSQWNPHSTSYAHNEEHMLDWEGNMIARKHRISIMLDTVDEDKFMTSALQIGLVEATHVDKVYNSEEELEYTTIPWAADEVNRIMVGTSPLLGMDTLCHRLETCAQIGSFQVSIGATYVHKSKYLHDTDYQCAFWDDNVDVDFSPLDPETRRDTLYEKSQQGNFNLDSLMVCATHARPRMDVDAKHLSKIWRIDPETAKKTLEITSQLKKNTPNANLTRNYSTNDRMLRYKRLNEFFFMDTFQATRKSGKSSRGNYYCQLFVTDKGFLYVVPMERKSDVLQAVKQFAKEIGAPEAIICDHSGEQTSSSLRKFCGEIGTTLRVLEEGTPWANRAECYIGLLKEAVRQDMKETNSPLPFWDYCVERRARIHNVTAKDLFQLHGSNPYTATLHEEADISNIARFGWYQWCYHRDHTAPFPHSRELLGRVLGPARGEGNEMAQWILKSNGKVVPRRTVRPLRDDETRNPIVQSQQADFDGFIQRRYGTGINPPQSDTYDQDEFEDDALHNMESLESRADAEDSTDQHGILINQQPAWDNMLQAEIVLNKDSHMGPTVSRGIVARRALSPSGKTTGTYDPNPILNTMQYEVEFDDGTMCEYAANVIAENMVNQIDMEGFTVRMLESIVDHKRDHDVAVPKEKGYVVTKRGNRRKRKTTQGWKLLVKWKNGSEEWIPLRSLKSSYPVEVAEYAKARGIDQEPAFAWWVPFTISKRNAIVAAVKSRKPKVTHKYGIEIPRNVHQALALDKQNNNTYWQDAIAKEMKNIGIAFEVLDDNEPTLVGWNKVTGHMIFDVKMDFTRKARWVLDGHKTPQVEGSTYAGVVSRESVRIALTYAAMNDLQVYAADIRNAYLQAPSSQKDYIICGPEFGLEHQGKRAKIHRALYGGKAAGRDFRNHLRSCMEHLNYTSCVADPDVWYRPAVKPDGTKCYEYILLYVDDVLAIGIDAQAMLTQIGTYFELKPESIGPPKIYLGSQLRLVELENGQKAWGISSSKYVQAAVQNVEDYLKQKGKQLVKKADTPMTTAYVPELDVSPELDPDEAAYFQSLIGILRWMVELGRVDICLEVSLLSSHLALPRSGHLEQVFRIFAYLKSHHNGEIVLDPSDPVINQSEFERRDWSTSEFSHVQGMKEELPVRMPEPRGQGFVLHAKVDADHATDTVTRRSRSGFLVWANSALIYWMSKKQVSVETSSFGSEFIAMKQCCEYLRGLRYKLRMMGIPCEGPAYIYGDNQSVLANTTIPDSALKKKSQSIAYHFIREGCARDEWRTAYVNTHENQADLLTKVLPYGEKRRKFVRGLIHHVYEHV